MAFSIPAVAVADTVYTLAAPNTALSSYPAPYGTATVHLVDSDTANISFAAALTGIYQYSFGGNSAVDVNVNATSWLVSNLAWNGVGPVSGSGSQNVSSFGTFNQTFDSFDGFSHRSTQVSFTLDGGAGTNWLSSDDVLTANASGYTVAMHGFACLAASCTGAVVTGYAGNGTTPPIPEPETYAMMLAGLGLLGFVARRRRQGHGNLVPA